MKYLVAFIATAMCLQAAAKKSITAGQLKHGQEVYMQNCVACHGVSGDGRGPAAVAIKESKPRDFISGKFKFGESLEEVFKTITNGSPGTAMPGWNSLPEADRWAVAAYVKSLKKEK